MRYVYLVYRDNGDEDPYDYYDWLESVHTTEESAREYILKTGIPRVKDAEFFDKEGDGKTITIYRSKRSLTMYDRDWKRGCNVSVRIERWELN